MAAQEVISLICVLEKIFKGNILALSGNLFLVVWPKNLAEVLQKWRNKNKFLSFYSSARVSPIKYAVLSGNSK